MVSELVPRIAVVGRVRSPVTVTATVTALDLPRKFDSVRVT
jgi:hypothetical protein